MLVNLDQVLEKAKAEKYAVGLFNTHDTDMLEAAISAAEEAHSPIIIGTAEVLLPYGDLPLIAPALVAAAKRATVPVVVHYDHGLTFEKTMEALKLGFSSVMYDASAKDYETNVAETAEMTKIAHALGATIEGEIGHVGLAQDGDDRNGLYTTVEEAVDFQTKTGVDALAVAVGNAHGVYKSKPCIQLDRIAELNSAVMCPLVMHGGSGLSADDFRNAIERGIAKMNIHTDMVCAGMRAMYESCDAHNRDKIVTWDYLDTRKAKVEAIKQVVARKLQLFGSVNKAYPPLSNSNSKLQLLTPDP
ncbi:MAG: class II fructose-bisphosphate aldolase [Kiritimatiellae bacterium]|nr:class II fructose-bisphosphate aldolase [Kiritimatiellia bacterium]